SRETARGPRRPSARLAPARRGAGPAASGSAPPLPQGPQGADRPAVEGTGRRAAGGPDRRFAARIAAAGHQLRPLGLDVGPPERPALPALGAAPAAGPGRPGLPRAGPEPTGPRTARPRPRHPGRHTP